MDLCANRRVVVVTFKEKLAVFDACTLDMRFTVTSCYPSPGVHANPVALGDRWLAYADKRLYPVHRSLGGMEADGSTSVTQWGINVGSRLARGVTSIYNNFFTGSASQNSAQQLASSAPSAYNYNPGKDGMKDPDGMQRGVVTVLDTETVPRTEVLHVADRVPGVVAHFIAHNKEIVAQQFDSTGKNQCICRH